MDAEQRKILKELVDQQSRDRAERGYGNCDPEYLSKIAIEDEEQGYQEQADAIRRFRDMVVNPLLGEGWSLSRIEEAAMRHFGGKK